MDCSAKYNHSSNTYIDKEIEESFQRISHEIEVNLEKLKKRNEQNDRKLNNPHNRIITQRFIEAVNFLLENHMVEGKDKIAESLDIPGKELDGVLNFRDPLGVDMVRALCTVYNISPFWIFNGQGVMHNQNILVRIIHYTAEYNQAEQRI